MSIQWGSSSVPCTLYLDSSKRCEMHLPTSLTLASLSSEVSKQFSVSPHSWEYSVPGHAFREQLTNGDQFARVLRGCAETKQMLQLNGVCSGGEQGDVGRMVREHLEREGPRLLRDLAHQHKICCCNDRPAVDGDTSVTSSQPAITSSLPTPSSLSQVASTSSQAAIVSSQTVESCSQQPPRRRSFAEEMGERKRQRVTLGEREFLLACLEKSHRVLPGQRMVARWNLIIRDTASRWEIEEEGEGPLLRVGEVEWSGLEGNIRTFSAAFLAPDQKGTYESRWTLLRDDKPQSSFIFCEALVGDATPQNSSSTTASHGNISCDVATPKLLNNNKVFCVSRQEQQWSHSAANSVEVPRHSSANHSELFSASTSGCSSANIPGHSSASGANHISFVNIAPGFSDDNNANVYEAGVFLEDADRPTLGTGDGEVKMLNI